MRKLLELEAVSVRLGAHSVLQGLSCHLDSNRVFAIVGPNAAGKSTFLHLLAGLVRPYAGQITFQGQALGKNLRQLQKNLGLMPSPPPLYPELTVREYLKHLGACRGLSGARLKKALEQVIVQCELQTLAPCLLGDLSSGYQRRVGIAQALIHQPALVLLDEPTAELDPEQRSAILELIHSLKHHQTVVFSTHLLEEALEISDQVLVLREGRFAHEPIRPFNPSLGSIYWLQFTSPPIREVLLGIPGLLEAQAFGNAYQILSKGEPEIIEQVLSRALEQDWGLTELRPLHRASTKNLWKSTQQGASSLCSFASPA